MCENLVSYRCVRYLEWIDEEMCLSGGYQRSISSALRRLQGEALEYFVMTLDVFSLNVCFIQITARMT
jgi:hypothetical protein